MLQKWSNLRGYNSTGINGPHPKKKVRSCQHIGCSKPAQWRDIVCPEIPLCGNHAFKSILKAVVEQKIDIGPEIDKSIRRVTTWLRIRT